MKRLLRYSLRTALVVTLVAACACAYTLNHYRGIKNANVAIKDAGGSCGYAMDGPEWLREVVNDDQYFYNPLRITLGTITGNCKPEDVTDETIANLVPHMCRFSRLETLDLRTVAITDDGIATLLALPHLKTLRLDSEHITDAGVLALADFYRLERVLIKCDNVSNDAIDALTDARPDLAIDRLQNGG